MRSGKPALDSLGLYAPKSHLERNKSETSRIHDSSMLHVTTGQLMNPIRINREMIGLILRTLLHGRHGAS